MTEPIISSQLLETRTNTPVRSTVERRADLFCAIALCLLTLLTWAPRWRGPIDVRWDGGTYYVLGTSLAEGKGYRLLNEPGEIRADQYPPLLPAIVAAHQKVLGTADPVLVGIWLRRTWIAISVLYILTSFLLARLFLSRGYAFVLALICLVSYDMYYFGTLCFAELPFALTTTLFVYLHLRKDRASWTHYVAPVFAIASYLLRSMGIAVLAAWVADALFRRQFRTAAVRAVIALVPIAAWQGYVHNVEKGQDYQHPYYAYQRDPSMFYNVSYAVNMQLKDPFQPQLGKATLGDYTYRFVDNLLRIPSTLGQSISAREGFYQGQVKTLNRRMGRPFVPQWPYKVVLNCLGWLVLAGLVRLAWKGQWLIPGIVSLTVTALCSTPWPGQFARYLTPTLPLLLLPALALLQSLGSLSTASARRWKALRLGVLGLMLGECVMGFQSGNRNFLTTATYQGADGKEHTYRLLHYSADYPEVLEALRWLVPRADKNAVLCVSMPQWIYLNSGLKSVMPPLGRDPVEVQRLSDTVPISYVIIERLLMDDNFNVYFPKLIQRSRDKWKQIYTSRDGTIQIYGRVGIAALADKPQVSSVAGYDR